MSTAEKTSLPQAPVVLITGAAKRLGREMAQACASAGWRVAVHYHHSEADAIDTVAALAVSTCEKADFHAYFRADLGDESAVRALGQALVQRMGRWDAVINSAALFEHDDASSFQYNNFHKHLAVNTAAAIVLAQRLHTQIKVQNASENTAKQGVVINLLDQKLWNQNPDFLSYTLSKAALEAANTMLAMALAPEIRVVGVAPGLTLTSHMLSDQQFHKLHALSPLQRSSTPEDVCQAVLFALSNRAITGTTLLVDGGQHLMRFERDFSMMPAAER